MDRFDLEQNIMKCWNVTDDIDLVYKNVMESDMSNDDIANALLGLKTLYDMRFEELFNNFETMIHERKIL
jgi:hypothetical protein